MKKVLCIVMMTALLAVISAGCAQTAATQSGTQAAASTEASSAPASSAAASVAAAESNAMPSSQGKGDDPFFVGLAFGGLDATPTVIMQKLTAKMEEQGWKYVVTNGDLDTNKYIADVENLIQQKPDVIVTRTPSEQTNAVIVPICVEANVPVLLLSNMTTVPDYNYLGHVADPELVRGIPLANWLNDYVEKNPGFVPKIGFVVGNASTDQKGVCERSWNIRDNLKVDWKEVISAEASPNWSASGAMLVVEDWMQKYTIDDMNTIVCWSDEMCVGVIQALQAAGKNPGDYLLLSYDGLPLIQEYVSQGWVAADSGLDLEKMCNKVMDALQQVKDGQASQVPFLNYANSIYVLDGNNVEGITSGSQQPQYFDYSSYIEQ